MQKPSKLQWLIGALTLIVVLVGLTWWLLADSAKAFIWAAVSGQTLGYNASNCPSCRLPNAQGMPPGYGSDPQMIKRPVSLVPVE